MGAEETVCTNCHMTQPSPTEMMVLNVAALGAAIFSVMLIASLFSATTAEASLVGLLFILAAFFGWLILVLYSLVDVLRMPNDESFKTGTQIVWVVVILLTSGLGALIYLSIGRPPGGATLARQQATALGT